MNLSDSEKIVSSIIRFKNNYNNNSLHTSLMKEKSYNHLAKYPILQQHFQSHTIVTPIFTKNTHKVHSNTTFITVKKIRKMYKEEYRKNRLHQYTGVG